MSGLKKGAVLWLVPALALVLTGCGGSSDTPAQPSAAPVAAAPAAPTTPAPAPSVAPSPAAQPVTIASPVPVAISPPPAPVPNVAGTGPGTTPPPLNAAGQPQATNGMPQIIGVPPIAPPPLAPVTSPIAQAQAQAQGQPQALAQPIAPPAAPVSTGYNGTGQPTGAPAANYQPQFQPAPAVNGNQGTVQTPGTPSAPLVYPNAQYATGHNGYPNTGTGYPTTYQNTGTGYPQGYNTGYTGTGTGTGYGGGVTINGQPINMDPRQLIFMLQSILQQLLGQMSYVMQQGQNYMGFQGYQGYQTYQQPQVYRNTQQAYAPYSGAAYYPRQQMPSQRPMWAPQQELFGRPQLIPTQQRMPPAPQKFFDPYGDVNRGTRYK